MWVAIFSTSYTAAEQMGYKERIWEAEYCEEEAGQAAFLGKNSLCSSPTPSATAFSLPSRTQSRPS